MLSGSRGPLSELVDERDSKSRACKGVPVRIRGGPPVPSFAGLTVRCSVAAMSESQPGPARESSAGPAATRAEAAAAARRGRTAQGFGLLLIPAFAWGLNWPLMKY